MARERTRQITMRAVARMAGVSQTTVSLVINNVETANISLETRQRVLTAIRQLGYRPNAAARYMRTNKSHYIGFITDEIATTPHAGKIVKGAQDVAWQNGKLILLINTGGDEELERQAIEVMLQQRVEGIIYAAMYHRPVTPPENLREVPAVLLNCYDEAHRFPTVVPDEIGGGYAATEVLLRRGHRRIAFANYTGPTPGSVGRLEGYRRALADYGVPYEENLVSFGPGEANGGYECTLALFRSKPRPTALFCFNDRMAMGAYDALRKLQLAIPEDVAVMGFDNQEIIAAHLHPGLSTVELPHYQMGRWAVQYLLEHLDEAAGDPEPIHHIEPCPVVLRESV